MDQLSPNLVFVIGLLTTLIVWLLKEAFIKKGVEVPKWVYNIILGLVALGLAFAFMPIAVPPFPSHDGSLLGILSAVLAFAGALLPILLAAVGFAKIIYEDLLEKVLKGLGDALRAKISG